MSTQVYIVTRGEYDEYGIDFVWLDKDMAEALVALKNEVAGYGDYRLEEWDSVDVMDSKVNIYFDSTAYWDEVDCTAGLHTRRITTLEEMTSMTEAASCLRKSYKDKGLGKNPDGSWKYYECFQARCVWTNEVDSRTEAMNALYWKMVEEGREEAAQDMMIPVRVLDDPAE